MCPAAVSCRARLSSKRGGVIKSSLALFCFVAALGGLGWMTLLPKGLQSKVADQTGFPVSIEHFASNPFGYSLDGENLVIGNPAEFGGGADMLVIRRLEASGNPTAVTRGEVELDELTIEVSKARLVADERGNLNLKVFLDRLFSKEGHPMPFRAERVHLVIDEVVYDNYAMLQPSSRGVRTMLDVELRNVTEPLGVFEPIVQLGQRIGAMP